MSMTWHGPSKTRAPCDAFGGTRYVSPGGRIRCSCDSTTVFGARSVIATVAASARMIFWVIPGAGFFCGRSRGDAKYSFGIQPMLGAAGFVALEHELLVLAEEERVGLALDRFGGHDDLPDVGPGRDLVHHVEEDLLDDRPQAAGAGLPLRRAGRGRDEPVLGELQLHLVDREELLVLLHDRVLGLSEDPEKIGLVERLERDDDRHAADELGDEPVLQEVVRHDLLEDRG